MKVRILGCGTSTGVPRIGNDWGRCDPAEPRNRRRRVSILVEAEGTRILVDTTPDLREQLNGADVATVHAVIWTHEHADHVHGIDDLRQLFHNAGVPVNGFAAARTLTSLRERFTYIFEGRWGYPSVAHLSPLEPVFTVGPLTIRAAEQPHGAITSTGLRFEQAGRAVGYATDFKDLPDDSLSFYEGVDLWIADALRERPHPSHSHLDQTIAYAARIGAPRTVLTHMDNSMDYRLLLDSLPPHIEPAYDGMEIEL